MILAVQSIFSSFSMVMIHYGMEQVVDQTMTAVLSTILLGFANNCHLHATADNIEMRLCCHYVVDEDTPVEIIEIYVQ